MGLSWPWRPLTTQGLSTQLQLWAWLKGNFNGFLQNMLLKKQAICRCLDEATKYSLERKTFGRPIASYQMVQAMLADMAQEIEAARLCVYKASWLRDQVGLILSILIETC